MFAWRNILCWINNCLTSAFWRGPRIPNTLHRVTGLRFTAGFEQPLNIDCISAGCIGIWDSKNCSIFFVFITGRTLYGYREAASQHKFFKRINHFLEKDEPSMMIHYTGTGNVYAGDLIMQAKNASYRLSQRLGIGLALLLLAACTSVPFDYPREASYQGKAITTGSLAQLDETWLHGQSQHTAVYPLSSGTDAYQIRLDLINRAQATIDAQYFLIKPDAAGVGFSGALLRAADRGVRVRLLLDDIFTTADDEGLALLNTHDNIQVRLFNPLSRQGFS
jgi:hypothetical protein